MAWQIDHDLWVMARPTRLDQVTRLHVGALISVNHRTPDSNLVEQFRQVGAWMHMPLPDGKHVDQLRTGEVVRRVQWFHQKGYQVALHCDAGRNRACLVAALVVKARYGWSGKQAAEYVRFHRPRALANEHAAAWLESLP